MREKSHPPETETELEQEAPPEESKEKEKKPDFDAAIVFGFGVLSPENQKTPDEKEWHLSLGARLRLDAAAALYKMEEAREIFVSEGGKGAETMKRYLTEYWGLPENIVKEEAYATNTLENFAHTINMLDEKKQQAEKPKDYKYGNLAFISSGFHAERIKQLAKLFEFEGKTVSAEAMIDHAVRSGTPGFKEKQIEHAEFEQDEETGKKVWKPTEHDPKKTGFNLEEMKNRFHNPNNPAYQEWLHGENKWTLPILKHGWENYFLQNIAIVNTERLQRMIAGNENIQKFIAEFAKDKIETSPNLKPDDQKKLKTVQQELNNFLKEKKLDPESQKFGQQIKDLQKPGMEEFQKLLQNINRLSSTIFKTEKEEIEKQWNDYFEDTGQKPKKQNNNKLQ